MKYPNGAAFRRALEDRLQQQSLRAHSPLVRLRKLVAFDRLLARLVADSPETWLLKGVGAAAPSGRPLTYDPGHRSDACQAAGELA
jgi:hypothetical protein